MRRSLITCQMIRVISSPSSSTTLPSTLIFDMNTPCSAAIPATNLVHSPGGGVRSQRAAARGSQARRALTEPGQGHRGRMASSGAPPRAIQGGNMSDNPVAEPAPESTAVVAEQEFTEELDADIWVDEPAGASLLGRMVAEAIGTFI